jgi:hypothetical protein
MNIRHAAALALVGWYLMLPPVGYDSKLARFVTGGWNDDGSPNLSRWEQAGSFDTASDCQSAVTLLNPEGTAQLKTDRAAPKLADIMKRRHSELVAILEIQKQNALCVATDDPRLKGN